MSDGFTIDTPCEHETGKAIWRSANHRLEVGTQLVGRRHAVNIQAHTLGVSFGRAREVGDEAVQIVGRERTNSQSRVLSIVTATGNRCASDQLKLLASALRNILKHVKPRRFER